MAADGVLARQLLLTLAAAAVIVAGILGMHSFSFTATAAVTADPVESASVAMEGTHAGDAHAEPAQLALHGCDDDCGGVPHHDMLAMACVLALLVLLLLVAAPPARRGGSAARRRSAEGVAALLTRAAPLRPPSLLLLSISRT